MLLRKSNPDSAGRQQTLYPGDEVMLLSMEYFVADQHLDEGALQQEVIITINSGDLPATVIRIPMKKLSNF